MESDHLILEISCCKVDLLRLDDTAYMRNFRKTTIVLPLPLAAPSYEREHTMLVAKVVDSVILTPDVLETDKVHVHMLHILYLSLKISRLVSEEDVICPTCSLEKDILAVEGELSVAELVKIALDLTYTESHVLDVRNLSFRSDLYIEVVELRSSELPAPPYARVLHMEIRSLLRSKHHCLSLVCR